MKRFCSRVLKAVVHRSSLCKRMICMIMAVLYSVMALPLFVMADQTPKAAAGIEYVQSVVSTNTIDNTDTSKSVKSISTTNSADSTDTSSSIKNMSTANSVDNADNFAGNANGLQNPTDSDIGKTDTKDEAEDTSSGQNTGTLLRIDNQNIYEGMTNAYKDGYQPVCSGGKVTIVLPLICEGKLYQDTLIASVDLGSTENSPFVYEKYEKSFKLTSQPINKTQETREVYCVTFSLKLEENRSNGIYPVVIEVVGKDNKGQEVRQSFTNYVVIKDGADPNAAAEGDGGGNTGGADTVETPTSAPVVLVIDSQISTDTADAGSNPISNDNEDANSSRMNTNTVEAGNNFTVTVTLKNTSKQKNVQNMVATVNVPSSDFELLNDSNTIFVGKLGKDKTTELTLHFHVSKSLAEGNYPIEISMSYDDFKAVTYTSVGSFNVTVAQPLEVTLTMPQIAKEVYAGDTIPLNFQVMNLGRNQVFNVRCDVTGNGLTQTKTAFVGNMESGTSGEAAANIFIDQLEGDTPYGQTTGTITLTYEDSFGEEHYETYTFDISVAAPVSAVPLTQSEEETTASQWWISMMIVGGICLLLASTVAAYIMGRKKR